jgi:hypothetical protein
VPPPPAPGSGASRVGPTAAGILDDHGAGRAVPDGSQTVSRAALDTAPVEEAPPPPSPVPTPIIVLGVLLGIGLIGLVAAILLSRGDDEPGGTTATTAFEPEEVPPEPQVALNPAGIRVTWEGREDANYVVLVLSEDDRPLSLAAEGPAAVLPFKYHSEGAYCIAVAYADELQAAPAGQETAAFSPPSCVNGASQESVLQR